MPSITAKGAELFVQDTGTDGPPLLLLHGLGMDHNLWSELQAYLPDNRLIMPDMRGHGKSDVPDGPYGMGTLVSDAEAVLDGLGLRDVVVVGLSLGGMIAQGLAVKRLDLVRGLVLANTAAKFGQPEPWHARAATARTQGMGALVSETLARWHVQGEAARWAEETLRRTAPEGYAACCEAIAGTDFWTPTSGLRLPTLGLGSNQDKSTPPDLVAETTALIPGSTFKLIRGAGHPSALQQSEAFARALLPFLTGIAHVRGR